MTSVLAQTEFSHYGPLGVLLLMVIVFAIVNVGLSHLLGPRRQGKTKSMPYESGVNPLTPTRRRFNVRFYIVAMTFLVFDVEIVFLYPWGTVFGNLGEDSALAPLFLGRMLFFVLTTVIAFVYAWRKGVFRYD
jgi:NADH-quinone oxidoreductase subunit A